MTPGLERLSASLIGRSESHTPGPQSPGKPDQDRIGNPHLDETQAVSLFLPQITHFWFLITTETRATKCGVVWN